MKKKIVYQICKACFVALLFTFVACEDKDYSEPIAPEPSDEPSLLDYSTSRDIRLSATYGEKDVISLFDVYTQNPLIKTENGLYKLNRELTPVAGGICVDGEIDLTKTIPLTAKELYIYSPSLFVPTLMRATIEGSVASFDVVDLSVDATAEDSPGTRTLADGKIDGFLARGGATLHIDIDKNYRPNYIVGTKIIPAKYQNRITNTFPNEKAVTNPDYYRDAILHMYEPAELKLAMVRTDAAYKSTLSYFFYEGTPDEITTVPRSKIKEIVAIPYAKLDRGLKAGEMVQLLYYNAETRQYVKEFPAGTTVGFMLRANAFTTHLGMPQINLNTNVFYSALALNKDNFQHTIFFDAALPTEDESFYCFGFEDSYGGGDKDCNDVMFHVDVSPAEAIVKPEPLPEVGTITYIENRKGVIGFEDNWPWKGDYDLNDVVVNYNSKITYIQKTEGSVPTGPVSLQMLDDKITLVHSGGDITCGFAYKVNISPSVLNKITIDDKAYTQVADGSGFIVKICDNVGDEVKRQNPSLHVYTCTPKTFNVKMIFKEENGIDQNAFYGLAAPYNPYIMPSSGDRENVEVHLPYYPPTTKANMSLFGHTNDKSNPDKGIWYVGSEDNPYPFAVHLFNEDGFKKLPVEHKEISYTYPKFIDWVNSKLTSDRDWYKYPN